MPEGRFTNVSSARGSVSVPASGRNRSPYVSKPYGNQIQPLTAKEKQARTVAREMGAFNRRSAAFGIDPVMGANTVQSGTSSFFSPQLSTDFLQLPQSIREKREIYRHFYNTDEIVAQAIDLHTELPLSKVRLAAPKPRIAPEGFDSPEDYGKYILSFFERMTKRIKLFQKLIMAVHHLWLDGTCLPPDEWVTVDGGIKKAEDVEVGDQVLTHRGRYRPVTAVAQFNSDKMCHLNVARIPDDLRVTPEHPVEVLRDETPLFIEAGKVRAGDFVRVTYPTEVRDIDRVDLLDTIPSYVSKSDVGGYIVTRQQVRPRTKEAVRLRDYLLTWLSQLTAPVMRSQSDIAAEAGVALGTLTNVLLTLDQETPTPIRVRIPTGKKIGPHTLWLPLVKPVTGNSHYSIDRTWDFTNSVVELPVNDDLLYVVGYWLGDGSLVRDGARSTEWGRGHWTIAGGNPSLSFIERVQGCLERLLGKDHVVRSSEYREGDECRKGGELHVLRVRSNPAFVEWWARNFGETSHGDNPKRLPSWALTLPHDKQLSLLAGVIDSDGCVPRTHVGGVQIGLTSIPVISAVRDLMLRLGSVPSMAKTDHNGETVVREDGATRRYNYPSYTLFVGVEDSARKLVAKSCKSSRLDEAPRFFQSANSYLVVGGNTYFKVNSVQIGEGGPVYNFQVEEDETFRVRYVSTHNCPLFAEDSDVQVPTHIGYREQKLLKNVLTEDGEAKENFENGYVEKNNREQEELDYYQKHYQGWERLIVFPIDQIEIKTFSFSDKMRVELIPSERDRALLEEAKLGDPVAEEMVMEMPDEVREYIGQGRLIPLGTDPDEGSFVYMLSSRKQAGEELGQSILDRCHIAGIPVLVKRDGVVQQVPIEALDPDIDLVLSHTGAWREFEVGVRNVDEQITLLHVAKIDSPIGSTSDHRYPVLRGDGTVELEAKDIQPGDYLQVAQIPLTESVHRVDLAAVMDGVSEEYKARKSGQEVVQTISIVDRTDSTFVVQYSKPETNLRMRKHLDGLTQAIEWLQGITEPTTVRALTFCKRFGFNHNILDRTLEKLGLLGARYEAIGRSHAKSSAFDIRFEPSEMRFPPKETTKTKSFPRWLELDADLGYFLGYWLGDGHIAKQPGLDYGVLGFTYGPNESASVVSMARIKAMLDQLKVAWSESPIAGGIHVDGYQDALIRWVAANFGHTCEDKHLPEWIIDAPKAFLMSLLRGFCDSDGDVVMKKDGSVSVRFSGTNKVLLDQTFLLCTSLGFPVSKGMTERRWVKQADGRLSYAKESYAVHFTHGPSVKRFFESGFLAKRKEPDVWKDGRSGSRHKFVGNKLYYRVAKTATVMHTGPVYSLNVHVDHSLYVSLVSTRNCLRTLYFREKLRQAQSQIADRAMTPKRIVWAEDISDADADDLREQVDLSLVDPDYSIIANYEVHWEEMGSKDRLLDLSAEYEQTERRLRTGLGVTESLLSGESLYSGDRLKLEVINQRYLFLREMVQEYVEEYLFKPVARRKGFVEKDKWGEECILFPKLSFTRLPLRDSQDTYDALFNLYQKGSISIDLILEMFNIDPDDTARKIKNDIFTVNDAIFNEMTRGMYSAIGQKLADSSDATEKIAKYLNLKVKEQEAPGQDRFGG